MESVPSPAYTSVLERSDASDEPDEAVVVPAADVVAEPELLPVVVAAVVDESEPPPPQAVSVMALAPTSTADVNIFHLLNFLIKPSS